MPRREPGSAPRLPWPLRAGARAAVAAAAAIAVPLALAGCAASVASARPAGHVTPAGSASPAGAGASAAPSAAPSASPSAAPVRYYLALGDSLSQGVQPDPSGQSLPTSQGYADDLLAHYQSAIPGLRLEKLGCSGETTTSMLTGQGSPCSYPAGSQLAAALDFIRAHRSQIALITIDIGANDLDSCATGGSISQSCVKSGVASLGRDMPRILGAIRLAAGTGPVIAGMNLYDPVLSQYRTGMLGRTEARLSTGLSVSLNAGLSTSFRTFGMKVANVQAAFSTTDFTNTAQLPGTGAVPLSVARICQWTWMCASAPVGPNIHANATGYQQIATAFEQVIGPLS